VCKHIAIFQHSAICKQRTPSRRQNCCPIYYANNCISRSLLRSSSYRYTTRVWATDASTCPA